MFNIIADMHCHTIASSHAYSTVLENITAAKNKNLKLIAITDHANALPDSPHPYYFFNLRVWPRQINGVYLLKGVEANVTDFNGNIDISNDFIGMFEWIIASMHEPVLEPGTPEEHLNAWVNVCKNKYVDVIGHSGTEIFKCNYELFVKECKANNKIIEIIQLIVEI